MHSKTCGGRQLALVLAAAAIAGCGGSGEESTSTLTSTGGNALAYVGLWKSECGSAQVDGQLRGVKLTFDLTSASGSTVTGKFTRQVYWSERDCSLGAAVMTSSISDVTLRIDAAAASVTGDFAGTADRAQLSSPGTAASTIYFGFYPDRSGFLSSYSPRFVSTDVPYRKVSG